MRIPRLPTEPVPLPGPGEAPLSPHLGRREEVWAASRERKREPGAAAGPTDIAQAASSALLMGESSAKPTPRKGIKQVRSYRIFIKSGVVYRAV